MRMIGIGMVGAVALCSACTVHGYAESRPAVEPVEVTSAPVEVNYETYPHTVYEGRTVYYVRGRWGYPERGRWSYYRSEPAPLVRYRSHVETAPPAPRGRVYEEPRGGVYREEAPPAVRTR